MKKRLLSLIMSLCMIVVLLPPAGAAEEEDFSQYYTDNMLTDEEITLGGIPIYDLTYDKAKEIIASMPSDTAKTEKNDYEDRFRLDFVVDGDPTPQKAYIKAEKIGIVGYGEDSSILLSVSMSIKYGGDQYSGMGIDAQGNLIIDGILPIKAEMRDITLCDTVEEVARKIGFSDEGSKILADKLTGTPTNYDSIVGFYTPKWQSDSRIYWHSDRYMIIFSFNHGRLTWFDVFTVTEEDVSQNTPQKQESKPAESLPEEIPEDEHIYDVPDAGEDIVLPVWRLEEVVDKDCTVKAIDTLVQSVPAEQLKTPTGIDLATLYAETALMRAASKEVKGGDILINAEAVKILESVAVNANAALEEKMKKVGIPTAREIAKTVTFMTNETGVNIRIDPDILKTKIDKVRVETPTYALTFKLADLEGDLTEVLTFRAEDTGAGYAPSKVTKKPGTKTVVKVDLPNGKMSNPVTVSMPKAAGETTYQAVVSTEGTATASKYNPASDLMDGKVNTSGSYTVKSGEKDFSDIANKSAEMQKAIRYLASKGIINGTTETTFSPDGSINRAEIASLVVKALGKLDSSATADFTDVARGSWYYSAAASSQKQGYIQGYEDRTFRGPTAISKIQIVSVAGRILTKEMGYKKPASPAEHLKKFSDSVAKWAEADVALAAKENLVVYRKDGTFSGDKSMTRGDAAILIYRMFQRIW